jgi:hypothetical protein
MALSVLASAGAETAIAQWLSKTQSNARRLVGRQFRRFLLARRVRLYRNCVKTPSVYGSGVLFERKADSPSYCFH